MPPSQTSRRSSPTSATRTAARRPRGGPDPLQRELLAEIPAAIASGAIGPWFQPIVEVATHRIVGWEALVRWGHPRAGSVSPATLLPIVNASGAAPELTAAIIDRSVAFASAVMATDRADASTVHVNVEPTDLRPGLRAGVAAALRRYGVPGDRLVLEITERHVIGIDQAVVDELNGLRTDGVRIAVDDFGTGFSSLSHLLDLPIDCVKIDRRFVDDADELAEGASVVRAILGLARGLGLSAVAEGVETAEQLELLGSLGCGQFQGFLVSPAVPRSAAIEMLTASIAAEPTAPS